VTKIDKKETSLPSTRKQKAAIAIHLPESNLKARKSILSLCAPSWLRALVAVFLPQRLKGRKPH